MPLCPEFVLELKSPSDRLKDAQRKMRDWIGNGCQLAWLLDVAENTAYIHRPAREPETVPSMTSRTLSGEAVLPGFELDLGLFSR